MLLKNKVVVIFGGSGAIGSAAARNMAREGARVYLVARGQEKLDRVAHDIRTAGGTANTLLIDVLDETAMMTRVAELASRAGGFDIVVNATGFMHDQGKKVTE